MEPSQPTDTPAEKGITSYVQVISATILQSPQQKLLIREIYESIKQNWERYSLNQRTWKTSVRHSFSSNPFFIHNGRGPNGHAHYWPIHASCVSMFKQGDFRRLEATRRVQYRDRETKQRSRNKISSYQDNRKDMRGKSQDNKEARMQRHHNSIGNESTKIAEPNDSSSSAVLYSAQLNQHQHVQHHNYQQQQAKQLQPHQQQKLPQIQQLPQTQQMPQYQRTSQIQQVPRSPATASNPANASISANISNPANA